MYSAPRAGFALRYPLTFNNARSKPRHWCVEKRVEYPDASTTSPAIKQYRRLFVGLPAAI